MAMAERGLKEEIELMLKLVPGDWRLECKECNRQISDVFYCVIVRDSDIAWKKRLVSGIGHTKAEAMKNLLFNWREGITYLPIPAPAGSREELELKLAIRGRAA